ncbi:MAG: hypothetical protein M3Q65_23955 [Chloroflexota bacterium]|nr:hypothetical protein [Chloroflexota bacterium]
MTRGSGGIHGPLFADGSFAYLPIPDGFGLAPRTYGNLVGRHGRKLSDYFPPAPQRQLGAQPVHLDPEFATCTYGDPTPPKAGLRRRDRGDLLIVSAGLAGWDHPAAPALYSIGDIEVRAAGLAREFGAANFHVRHPALFAAQRDRLVLIKGTPQSRLSDKAVPLSAMGQDRRGKPLNVLSPQMREVFGGFGGRVGIQRSPPRWVDPAFVPRAAAFVKALA